jgi:predicted RNase H-like HicB family nuclease
MANPMTTYTAVLTRDPEPGVWTAQLAEEERVHTFGRSIQAALDHLKDAAALWFEVPIDEIELVPDPVLPAMPRKHLCQALEARDAAETAVTFAQEWTSLVVSELSNYGLSRRDIAALLGISHQRVQQLEAKSQIEDGLKKLAVPEETLQRAMEAFRALLADDDRAPARQD